MIVRRLSVVAVALSLLLPGAASAKDAGAIDGYKTNDFFRFWPEGKNAPEGHRLKKKNTTPSKHMSTAEYEADDGSSMANVRIVGWPMNKPEAVANDDEQVVERSIAGIRKNMADERWPDPEQFEIAAAGRKLACLRTPQNKKAEMVYCVTPMKGRVMEIQYLASIEAHDKRERNDVMQGFVRSLTEHMEAAK